MMKYRTNKQKSITIGLVLPHLKSRGTEKQALRLAKGFAEKGLRVVLFVVQGWGMEFMYQAFRDAGVEVVNVGRPVRVGQKAINLSRVFSLAWLARKYSCDILISRAFRSNQISGWAGLIAFIPTILVLSSPVVLQRRSIEKLFKIVSVIRFVKNFGLPRNIVSITRESAQNFSLMFPFYSNLVKTIYNGVDVSAEGYDDKSSLHLDRNHFNICFSGSLEIDRKGVDLLIEALKQLVFSSRIKRACLILIGTGQDEFKIKDLVRINGLDKYVMFAGEQKNPFPIIKECDVFVFPSRREGFGNSLLEAMALGVCCISADCNYGPREIIKDGHNGILVPPENSRAIAEAIVRIKEDSDLRKMLASNVYRTIAEKFSCQQMIDHYYELVMRLM